MSESDNDVGRTDEPSVTGPGPDSDGAAAGGDVASTRRALRGWGAAQSSPSVVAKVRSSLSTLFVPPELADTLPPDTARPNLISRLFGNSNPAKGAEPESVQTLEFQPKAEVTLYGDTPLNLDLVDRAHELDVKTDEFEFVPMSEVPTAPLPHPFVSWLKSARDRLMPWRRKPAPIPEPAAETVIGGNPVFLFSKFRAFYNEVIRFRHQHTAFGAGFATALLDEAVTLQENPNAAAEALSRKLLELLELQAAEAKWMGGEMAARYPEAQYAMAALADELFLNFEWAGRSAWQNHLLEPKLFRTHGAAYEVFKRMDRLLKDAPNTPVSRDLARVYLLVVAAGFQGKYRPFGLTRALAEYRQRLYEYIYRDDALMLYAPDRRIIPEVSARTVEGHAVARISAARRWAAVLVFVVLGYTLVAHVAWNRVSSDLSDVTSRIVADSPDGGR